MQHHAPRVSYSEVKHQLRELGVTKLQLGQPEVKKLSYVLFEDEVIQAFLFGFYEGGYGMLAATDKRIIFLDIMPFGRFKIEDFPYGVVSATELKMGLFSAECTIFSRPKSLRFWWAKKDNAEFFVDYVENRMLESQQRPAPKK